MNKILPFKKHNYQHILTDQFKKLLKNSAAQNTAEETNNNIYSNSLSTTNIKKTKTVDRSQKFSKHTQNTFKLFTTRIFLNLQYYNEKPFFKSQLQMNTNANIHIFLSTFS